MQPREHSFDDGVVRRRAAGRARARDVAGRCRRLHPEVRRRDARRHAAPLRPQAQGSRREGHQRPGRGQGLPRRSARRAAGAYRGTAARHHRGLRQPGRLLRRRRLALRHVQHSVPVQGPRSRQPHAAGSGAHAPSFSAWRRPRASSASTSRRRRSRTTSPENPIRKLADFSGKKLRVNATAGGARAHAGVRRHRGADGPRRDDHLAAERRDRRHHERHLDLRELQPAERQQDHHRDQRHAAGVVRRA